MENEEWRMEEERGRGRKRMETGGREGLEIRADRPEAGVFEPRGERSFVDSSSL